MRKIFFLFLHKNICYGHSSEVPSNQYHNISFFGEISKLSTSFGTKKAPYQELCQIQNKEK